mgnify:CR=1 FL=1
MIWPIEAKDWPTELSTLVIAGTFRDDDSTAVVPNVASWSLYDGNGAVVNARAAVPIAPLTTDYLIVLVGADLSITTDGRQRVLVLYYEFDSSVGTDLPQYVAMPFSINDIKGLA